MIGLLLQPRRQGFLRVGREGISVFFFRARASPLPCLSGRCRLLPPLSMAILGCETPGQRHPLRWEGPATGLQRPACNEAKAGAGISRVSVRSSPVAASSGGGAATPCGRLGCSETLLLLLGRAALPGKSSRNGAKIVEGSVFHNTRSFVDCAQSTVRSIVGVKTKP